MTILADSVVPESPRQYLRRHLQCHTSKPADLTWYLDQFQLPRFAGSAEVRLAVEELVDRLGDFLGFSTSRDEDDDYSRWVSATGHQFIVWTMDSARAVAHVGAGAHARNRQMASIAVGSDDLLTCV